MLNGESLLSKIEAAHKDPNDPVRILDFGCGKNVALREATKNNSSGIPIEATGISAGDPRSEDEKEYDKAHGITFIDQRTVNLAPPKGTYDIILSRMVFGHLPNPLETMRRLYQALRQGGTMWIEFKLHGIGSLENKFYDGSNPDQIGTQAQKVIDDLKSSGIDIEVGEDVLVIKKNDVKMRFPRVKVSPGVREEDGRFNTYAFKEKN